MGSQQLIAQHQLIDCLPEVTSPEQTRQVLGDLAAAIARQNDVLQPPFLPAGRDESWVKGVEVGQLTPDALGIALEALTAPTLRRSRGAHFTSRSLAAEVVDTAFEAWFEHHDACPRVLDPSAGGGAFLLAAADALAARGFARSLIIDHLHGADIDETSLDVCATALRLWSGIESDIECTIGDALSTLGGVPIADVIVGNPPFLAQLKKATSRAASSAERLKRYGLGKTRYLDEAGAFLLASTFWAAPGGVIALIVPQSLLGATDGQQARELFEARAGLRDFYFPSTDSFEAAVHVVVLTAQRGETTRTKHVTVRSNRRSVSIPHPPPSRWADALATLQSVPSVKLGTHTSQVLASIATATAGFRQHFYGLAPAVHECSDADCELPKLVTVGAIEPLRCEWGIRSVRFAGTKWQRPVVDLNKIEDRAVKSWFVERQQPKLLLATQTRVVETVVDPLGSLLPSVPVISIEQRREAASVVSLWHLAALLTSAEVSAWLRNTCAGTGLSSDTIRIRAASLMELRLPTSRPAWDQAADAAQRAHLAQESVQSDGIHHFVSECVALMHDAWETPDHERAALHAWWEREAAGRPRSSKVT